MTLESHNCTLFFLTDMDSSFILFLACAMKWQLEKYYALITCFLICLALASQTSASAFWTLQEKWGFIPQESSNSPDLSLASNSTCLFLTAPSLVAIAQANFLVVLEPLMHHFFSFLFEGRHIVFARNILFSGGSRQKKTNERMMML